MKSAAGRRVATSMATRMTEGQLSRQRAAERRHRWWLPATVVFGVLACLSGALLTAIDPQNTVLRSLHRKLPMAAHSTPVATPRPSVLTITGTVLQLDQSASSLEIRSATTVYTIHTDAGTTYTTSCADFYALHVGQQVTVLVNAYLNGTITAHSVAPAARRCGAAPAGRDIPRALDPKAIRPGNDNVPDPTSGSVAAQADSPPRQVASRRSR